MAAWRHHHVEDFCSKFHQCSASRFTHLSVRPNDKQLPLDIQGHLLRFSMTGPPTCTQKTPNLRRDSNWMSRVQFWDIFPKIRIQTLAIFVSTSFRKCEKNMIPCKRICLLVSKKKRCIFFFDAWNTRTWFLPSSAHPPTPSLLGFWWNFAPTDLWIGNFQLMVVI